MELNQITIPSLDLGKSVLFYKKLGLKLIVDALPYYARFKCPVGSSTFSLHQVEELPKGDGIYVYFECADLDGKVERLKREGIKFDQEPTDKNWLWREARLKDLDGNQLILYFAGNNRHNPPWRIEDRN
jgi:catechol 2,3-dioxygenase-like lactoylglutathione lyase family enzyme